MKEIDLRFVRGSGLNMSMYAVADYAAASNDRSSASGVAMTGWNSLTQKCVRLCDDCVTLFDCLVRS